MIPLPYAYDRRSSVVDSTVVHHLFLKGLIVGFCLAVPLGPIAALCIQRTTSRGTMAGLVSGLGAAVADAFYGTLAALGVTVISDFLISHRELFLRVGGAVLCVLGIRLLFFMRAAPQGDKTNGAGLLGDFLSTLVLTLTNPVTFIAFAAVFANLGVVTIKGHSILTVELVGGVFLGSALWWTILVGLVSFFRDRFGKTTLLWINRGVGVFVLAAGILYLFVLHPRTG